MLRRLLLTLAITAAAAGGMTAVAQADEGVMMSPSRHTFCFYEVSGVGEVVCSASDWKRGNGRGMYQLRENGHAKTRTVVGDPGDGTFTLGYGERVYFGSGTPRLRREHDDDIMCLMRRTGLRCENVDGHGFTLRLGSHRSF